jgi:hypothetical protein
VAPREALGLGVLVACGDVGTFGVLVACGVLLVVVGAGLVGVADAGVEGVTADEELGGVVGLNSSQAARETRKIARRTQVEVRIRRISCISRICRLCRISRSRPVRPVRLVRPGLSVPRFPARSAG